MSRPATSLFKIGGFYFSYFAFTGLFQPYWGVYLAALSFPAWQIGILTSLTQVNRIYAPAIWGWLADRSGRRSQILRIAGLGGVTGFIGLLFAHSAWSIFAVVLLATFFWSAALPLVEALTMARLNGDGGRYAQIRVWGSIGFIVASVLGGYWIQARGITVLPMTVVVAMAGLAIYAWILPEAPTLSAEQGDVAGFRQIIARREVWAVLGCCFLMLLSHGPYYSFYSIFVTEHGVAKSSIGWLWTVGVLAEVCVFMAMPMLTKRWSVRTLFLSCFQAAALRWALIGFGGGNVPLLLLAQLGHAWSFAICHATAMSYVHKHFSGPHQGKGQALYIGASFGLGGSMGGMLTGWVWEAVGGSWCFALAAAVALIGWCVAVVSLPKGGDLAG